MVWQADCMVIRGSYGMVCYSLVWWGWFGMTWYGMAWCGVDGMVLEGLYGESWGGSKHLGRWPGGAV